jgi:hypothetical protein
MERELGRELAAGHPLFGLALRTLARRQDCDDVLYAIEDGTARVAVVHLTWTPSPPDVPPFPCAVIYPNLAMWAQEGMRTDAEEFST